MISFQYTCSETKDTIFTLRLWVRPTAILVRRLDKQHTLVVCVELYHGCTKCLKVFRVSIIFRNLRFSLRVNVKNSFKFILFANSSPVFFWGDFVSFFFRALTRVSFFFQAKTRILSSIRYLGKYLSSDFEKFSTLLQRNSCLVKLFFKL